MGVTLAQAEVDANRVLDELNADEVEFTRKIVQSEFGDTIVDLFDRAAVDRNTQATKEFVRFLWDRGLIRY